ncbi:HTH_Tnp_Tc3_2 domain-containing protein [Trichonephila clavipes]|nr:HTH_Tnp_Tc3_2 domain-containing protein [Trichonephila clavipes]
MQFIPFSPSEPSVIIGIIPEKTAYIQSLLKETKIMSIDIEDFRIPPRRNRRQYERLTDFDRGPHNRPRRSRLVQLAKVDRYRPPPRSGAICGGRFSVGKHDGSQKGSYDQKSGAASAPATSPPASSSSARLPPSVTSGTAHQEKPQRSTARKPRRCLRSRRPPRRLPLTPHHERVSTGFLSTSSGAWSSDRPGDVSASVMNPDSDLRVLMTTAHVFLEAQPPGGPDPAAISSGSAHSNFPTRLVLQGTLTARRYVDDILTPIVLPMLSSRPGAIYQQDNARPHTARLSQQCLQGYDVLPWPARSPDLSPIEHVWTRWEGNCSRPEIQEN